MSARFAVHSYASLSFLKYSTYGCRKEAAMAANAQHVLCIDDDEDILDIARMCLETVGGLQVSCCNSGAKAMQLIREISPDLILLDVMMPDMDGPTTLKELRKQPALDHTPIVFMTARVQPTEVQAYQALGASAVVPKPFDPMLLANQVNDIWKHYHE
jgi:two-component system OmpR family response regulator